MRDAVRDPRELIGDDRAFVSARQKFLSAIIDSLKQRFTDNPGLISSFSVLNLTLFPSADEIEGKVQHVMIIKRHIFSVSFKLSHFFLFLLNYHQVCTLLSPNFCILADAQNNKILSLIFI